MKTTDELIASYYDWMKENTSWREINGWIEITTPYRCFVHIVKVYLRRSEYDGYKESILMTCGVFPPKDKHDFDEIADFSKDESFPADLDKLIQSTIHFSYLEERGSEL